MTQEQTDLVTWLLTRHMYWLRHQIGEQDDLSRPVPEGHWRWADVKTNGYGRKPAEELAADRARAAAKVARYTAELEAAQGAYEELTTP